MMKREFCVSEIAGRVVGTAASETLATRFGPVGIITEVYEAIRTVSLCRKLGLSNGCGPKGTYSCVWARRLGPSVCASSASGHMGMPTYMHVTSPLGPGFPRTP